MQFFRGIIFLSALTIGYVHAVSATDEIVYKQAKELSSKSLRSDLAYKIIESLTTEVGQRQAGSETKGKRQSGNVIGEIPGHTDEIVIIGGHLDSWDLGTQFFCLFIDYFVSCANRMNVTYSQR